MKKDNIIVTSHALIEFIKDNKKLKNPANTLKNKFKQALKKCRTWEARYYKQEDWKKIVKYKNIAIVYKWNVIITYYKLLQTNTLQLISCYKWKILANVEHIRRWYLNRDLEIKPTFKPFKNIWEKNKKINYGMYI